jgi:uncharacterized membrane protein YkoI
MRNAMTLGALIALSGFAALAAPIPPHFKGANLVSKATISLGAARTTALAARPGKITDQELEVEGGGSGLRYSFDIESQGKTYEVGVDARTGKVLENDAESAHPD